MSLIDKYGNTIDFARKPKQKLTPPIVDQEVGRSAGSGNFFQTLPGGGILQFDLNRLTMADFRSMRMHYQISASLNVLAFVINQINWDIECDDKKIKQFLHDEMDEHWTKLVFAFSQAFWAGYSPIAVNYYNDGNRVCIKEFRDLVPEECAPNWTSVDGWAPPGKLPPKIWKFDGISQNGFVIPVQNSLWYPFRAENGNLWGSQMLKAAFPAWFFSNLIHLFTNRYFERFGEPVPVGRAPLGADVETDNGTIMSAKKAMELIVSSVRNRATIVLPSDRDPDSKQYDYALEYLESQMRGADFERYLGRLDEEMSLAVFTPILLFRTADVGSYNLGQAHLKIFEQMVNALAGDMQFYINNYLIDRLKDVNFGVNGAKAKWVYKRLGTEDLAYFKDIVAALIASGGVKLDAQELGDIIGVSMENVEILAAPPTDPNAPPTNKPQPKPGAKPVAKPTVKNARLPLQEATARAVREAMKGNTGVTLGYRTKFVEALTEDGFDNPAEFATEFYQKVNAWLDDTEGVFDTQAQMKSSLDKIVESLLS